MSAAAHVAAALHALKLKRDRIDKAIRVLEHVLREEAGAEPPTKGKRRARTRKLRPGVPGAEAGDR